MPDGGGRHGAPRLPGAHSQHVLLLAVDALSGTGPVQRVEGLPAVVLGGLREGGPRARHPRHGGLPGGCGDRPLRTDSPLAAHRHAPRGAYHGRLVRPARTARPVAGTPVHRPRLVEPRVDSPLQDTADVGAASGPQVHDEISEIGSSSTKKTINYEHNQNRRLRPRRRAGRSGHRPLHRSFPEPRNGCRGRSDQPLLPRRDDRTAGTRRHFVPRSLRRNAPPVGHARGNRRADRLGLRPISRAHPGRETPPDRRPARARNPDLRALEQQPRVDEIHPTDVHGRRQDDGRLFRCRFPLLRTARAEALGGDFPQDDRRRRHAPRRDAFHRRRTEECRRCAETRIRGLHARSGGGFRPHTRQSQPLRRDPVKSRRPTDAARRRGRVAREEKPRRKARSRTCRGRLGRPPDATETAPSAGSASSASYAETAPPAESPPIRQRQEQNKAPPPVAGPEGVPHFIHRLSE